MNTLTLNEAIARAREWRAEASCSPAAAVAITLLNRLEELDSATAVREREATRGESLVIGQFYGLRHWPDYMQIRKYSVGIWDSAPALRKFRFPFRLLELRTQETKFGPPNELALVQFLHGPQVWIDVTDIDLTGECT